MKDLKQQIREIATYHSDDGTSGYLLNEEQISEITSLLDKLVEEAKPERVYQCDDEECCGHVVYMGQCRFNEALDLYESNLKRLIGGGK